MDALRTNPRLMSRLPTELDILEFISELTSVGFSMNDAVHQLSVELINTWNRADCPTLTLRHVRDKMRGLVTSAKEGKRHPRESHKAKKPKTGVPTRKSTRHAGPDEESTDRQDTPINVEEEQSGSSLTYGSSPDRLPRPSSRTRASLKSEAADQYKQQLSGKLFDILSPQKAESEQFTFDKDFYDDQMGPRNLWIAKKVSSDFKKQSQLQQKTEYNKERRRQLATGEGTSSAAATSMQMEDVLDDISDNDQDLGEADLCDFMDTSTIRSTPELLDRPCTRSTSALSAHEPIRSFLTTSTQTDSLSLDEAIFPKISTRKAAVVKGKVSTLIDPQILEAIVECETTARCSITTAISVTQIIANRIFGQNWELPLSLDKAHLRDIQILKKANSEQPSENETSPENLEESEIHAEASLVIVEDHEVKHDFEAAQSRVLSRKGNYQFRLPSMTAVREARHLISIETEKKIAMEMFRNECTIIPDGTGQKIIGKVGGAMLQVGGKTRVLPFQIMGNETRQNWAHFLNHVLSRMAALSEIEKKELWGAVLLFISDQCKTNKGLAKEVAQCMGLEHQPGQIFCNIHPVLMFDEKMKKMWQDLQIKIGAEKIFPSISYSNLDQETTVVILQCLDALMRLVSPSYSHKAWSRYFQFNKFLGQRKNRAFAVKDRRFGALPASCLVALHHFDDILNYLDQNPDCRNQLACICRGMADLEDVLKFSWACLGLIGIHLYEPYLFLIIDLNTVQSKLIPLFQQLFDELSDPKNHGSLCQLQQPAFKSLQTAWRSPLSSDSPYEKEVIESIQQYLEDADLALMQAHINEALKVLASGFADQKGSAYGFGPNRNEGPTLTQEASLETLDKFHTHSKAIENAFGHMDNLLRQTGPQGFQKAIQAMQIAAAKDLVFDKSHSWRSTSMSKRKEIKEIQHDWTESQKKLLDNGVKDVSDERCKCERCKCERCKCSPKGSGHDKVNCITKET